MVETWVVVAIIGVATSIIAPMITRLTTQNEVIRTQKETIEMQRRQLDRLEVTADVTDKLLKALPKPRGAGGTKP